MNKKFIKFFAFFLVMFSAIFFFIFIKFDFLLALKSFKNYLQQYELFVAHYFKICETTFFLFFFMMSIGFILGSILLKIHVLLYISLSVFLSAFIYLNWVLLLFNSISELVLYVILGLIIASGIEV